MTLPQAGAGKPDGLLATKLYVPRPQPGFVPRPRLLDRLEEGMARGLLLVCAPAGFGKTALLAHWAQTGRRPVAWLSLDAGDSDPARFWRHVAAALDRVWPGLAEQVTPLLDSPVPPSFEGLVTVMVNQLAAQPGGGEALLILDDYHLIEAQPVHASMGFLLEHRPPGLRLLLASRADPPLPLARLRGRGQLAELRAGDNDNPASCKPAAQPSVRATSATTAHSGRTRSGATASRSSAAASSEVKRRRSQPDSTAFVEAFSGSHRYVLDYLAEEVLDRQPDQVREFLLETSVLARLSGPLCDAVTGRTDGQQLLEQLERANLFLHPLDEVRGWWRYHQLFADLLRIRLQQELPERAPGLHEAAAAWSEAHGLADDAIGHALAAGDAAWAARLVERHADELLVRAEGATLARWLAALPHDLVGSRPRLLLAQALLTLLGGRMEGVEDRLDAAERALAAAEGEGDGPYEPSVGRRSSLLANIPAAIALDRALPG